MGRRRNEVDRPGEVFAELYQTKKSVLSSVRSTIQDFVTCRKVISVYHGSLSRHFKISGTQKGVEFFDETFTPLSKLLYLYLYTLHLENKKPVTRKQIIEDLNIDAKSLSSALKLLISKNLVEEAQR